MWSLTILLRISPNFLFPFHRHFTEYSDSKEEFPTLLTFSTPPSVSAALGW